MIASMKRFLFLLLLTPLATTAQPGLTTVGGPNIGGGSGNVGSSISANVIYASKAGAVLNSSVWSGGGTDDSVALQAMLNRARSVSSLEVVIDGPALISTNLVIYSNTKLRFTPNAGLFMAAHKNCWLIGNPQNTNYATTNIVIEGGVLNANGTAQNEYINNGFRLSGQPGVDGVWFGGVDNIILRDVMIVSAKAYTFHFTDSRNISVFNCASYYTNGVAATNTFYGNDGVHFNGNITNVKVRDFWAHQNDDDVFALMTDETDQTLPIQDSRWTTNSGSMSNIVIENVFLDGCKNVGKIQSYGSTNAFARDVTIRNVHGSATHQGFLVFPFSVAIPAENFALDGYDVVMGGNADPLSYPMLKLDGMGGKIASIRNVRISDNGAGIGSTSLISISPGCTNWIIDNVFLSGTAGNISSQDTAIGMIASAGNTNQPTVSINNLTATGLYGVLDRDENNAGLNLGVYQLSNVQCDPGTILNVGGFTNFVNGSNPKFIRTNFLSGIFYTNASGAFQLISQNYIHTEAAAAGTTKTHLITGAQGAALGTYITNCSSGQQVLGTSLGTTNLGFLSAGVPSGTVYCFTNQLVGSGNLATPLAGTGQIVTY